MLKIILPLLALLLLTTGCPTGPEISQLIVEDSIGSGDYAKLEDLELLILEYKIDRNPAPLQTAEARLAEMIANPSLNKEFEARVRALRGEVLLYLGNAKAARDAAQQAEQLFKTEPQLHLLKALLLKDEKERILLLEESRAQRIESGRLILELAELYYLTGEFGKSTGLYDEAFTMLPPPFVSYYRKNRDLARQFIENPPDNLDARDYIGLDKLLVSDVLNILLLQSHYLDSVAPKKNMDPAELIEKLKQEDYINPANLKSDDPLVRKDTAYLILAIISRLEDDPALMHANAQLFEQMAMKSPVPDIKVSDYFFDAVLLLVEREIMELPDGINFQPNKTISGLEFNEILKALKQYYGY